MPGQEVATIFGTVTNNEGNPVEFANVAIVGRPGGTVTSVKGDYQLSIPANQEVLIEVSHISYFKKRTTVFLAAGQRKRYNFQFSKRVKELENVEIVEDKYDNDGMIRIKPKEAQSIPSLSNGVESLIKTLPGVSSRNEMSSQYSVRGGNFDENLVYVNGIEVYRPFLVRAGQQEGLSFINSDLVSSINFSAGGFEAKYGDKMASVLDIDYKKPSEFGGSFSAGFMGGAAHVEGAVDTGKVFYLMGYRYHNKKFVLQTLDTDADYMPKFSDFQTYVGYRAGKKWEFGFLGNYSKNNYLVIPKTRQTNFGSVFEALQFTVYFDGKESDSYETYFGAFTSLFKPTEKIHLRLTTSAFKTYESEHYTIQGQYWLDEIEMDLGDDDFGESVFNKGVGTFINHARNDLNAQVLSLEHRGKWFFSNHILSWGAKLQGETIFDHIKEWQYLDSSGYSLPHYQDSIGYQVPELQPVNPLELNSYVAANLSLESLRYSGFVQDEIEFTGPVAKHSFNIGSRFNYWNLNEELLISPRMSYLIKPKWEKKYAFRLAAGYYCQPPFYRELRDFDGNLNKDIKAQKSIHLVLGSDHFFQMWKRPFVFTGEIYYKNFKDLIPYKVDNVRIRYYADNLAKGYATGIDLRLFGEFVKGVDSWAGISLMRIAEDIENDYYYIYDTTFIQTDPVETFVVDSTKKEYGYLPRPTDQRFSFNMFFQDYLPSNPTYKMHMNFIYGTGLPFGPPGRERYKDTLRMPAYLRVDIGFSKQLLSEASSLNPNSPFRYLKSLWITAEVFNLLDARNTISYLWIKDIDNKTYPVPNYLTPRLLSLRMIARF